MTRDDIIRMAREAGLQFGLTGIPSIERFAELVAAHEREACARVCWNAGLAHEVRQGADLCFELSEAIRARGDA